MKKIKEKEMKYIDDNWFPYDTAPSMLTKIFGTAIIISTLFFMCYGFVSFINDII